MKTRQMAKTFTTGVFVVGAVVVAILLFPAKGPREMMEDWINRQPIAPNAKIHPVKLGLTDISGHWTTDDSALSLIVRDKAQRNCKVDWVLFPRSSQAIILQRECNYQDGQLLFDRPVCDIANHRVFTSLYHVKTTKHEVLFHCPVDGMDLETIDHIIKPRMTILRRETNSKHNRQGL